MTPSTVASSPSRGMASPSLSIPSPTQLQSVNSATPSKQTSHYMESGSLKYQLIPPSPSRSRLDPQYSSRLPQSTERHAISKYQGPSTSTTSTPTVSNLDSSIFRPPPIQTTDLGDGTTFGTPDTTGLSYSCSSLSRSSERFFDSNNSPMFLGSERPLLSPGRGKSRRLVSSPNYSLGGSDFGYSDRFIPSRAKSNLNVSLWNNSDRDGANSGSGANDGDNSRSTDDGDSGSSNQATNPDGGAATGRTVSSRNQTLLNDLLRSELLNENSDPNPSASPSQRGNNNSGSNTSRGGSNFFRFESPRSNYTRNVFAENPTSVVNAFNLSPVGSESSQRLLATPQKRKRRIAKVPFKVLDAPALQDDFYLNLVDWSSLNVLAVGLGSCVYLWSACTSKVTKLCDLSQTEDLVTSVSWTQRGTHLAVGTNKGEVQLWDATKCMKVRTMGGHSARIGTLSWNGPTLASGSRDRLIYLRDMRTQQPFTARLAAHKQEVCGLKWSFDEPACLASGGNDNKLLVWDIKNHSQPTHRFADHTAAVKAIAWSPHQHGLLASGGGTADRCIRFWNTLNGTGISCVDTGSQVCNLAWSQNCNELVSTHGYSLNQIVVWKYPTMSKVATLTGHTYRVLYLAMSPDGSTIVTGAGDETLRFWQVFPGPRSQDKSAGNGLLFPNSPGSVIR